MKKIYLFIFLLLMFSSAQAQSFKPDRSAYVQFLTSAGGGSIRGQLAERGFKVMEVYYLLTEHHQIWMFPLTGILYDEQGKYYALWSRYIEHNNFFLCDSIVLRNLSTDGNGVWVDMEIHAGELDRKEDGWQLEDNDPPWHRKCKAVGFYVARTDGSNALKKLKNAEIFTRPCEAAAFDHPPEVLAKRMRSWQSTKDAMQVLHEKFPDEQRPLVFSNFRLDYHEWQSSTKSKKPCVLELLYCTEASSSHHLIGEVARHDGYIMRYSFKSGTWSAIHVKDTNTGWILREGYVNPATGTR